jgi:hypothetical protein
MAGLQTRRQALPASAPGSAARPTMISSTVTSRRPSGNMPQDVPLAKKDVTISVADALRSSFRESGSGSNAEQMRGSSAVEEFGAIDDATRVGLPSRTDSLARMRIARIVLASALVLASIERSPAQIIGACTQDSQCRPAIVNPCIVDTCVNQACYHTPLCPDDGVACNGSEFCIAAGATATCGHDGLDCNDGDACTIDSCQEPTGCTHVAANCGDGDVCTNDYCFPATGCGHNHIDGCCNSSVDCPDLPCVVGRLCAPPYCSPGEPR